MKFVNIFKLIETKQYWAEGLQTSMPERREPRKKKSRVVSTTEKSTFLPHTWTFVSLDSVGEDTWFLGPLSRTSPLHLAFLGTI
jgi:hypothetical protein